FGDASAKLLELLRFTQEFDDLVQLFLGLVNTGDVLKGDLLLLHGEQARAALAEGHGLVSASLHLPHHENPEADDQQEGQSVDEDADPHARLLVDNRNSYAFIVQELVNIGIIRRNSGAEGLFIIVLEFAGDLSAANG